MSSVGEKQEKRGRVGVNDLTAAGKRADEDMNRERKDLRRNLGCKRLRVMERY